MKTNLLLFSFVIFFASLISCGKEHDAEILEKETIEKLLKSKLDPDGNTKFEERDGVYFYLTHRGLAEYKPDDTIVIKYTAKSLKNSVTFAVKDEMILETPADTVKLIKGWQIALRYLMIGHKGILVVPYKYGFGKTRTGLIEPYSTLYYDFEMSVKNNNN